MKGFLYILLSEKLSKYYIGSTNDLERRLHEHNLGHTAFTKLGIPWSLIFSKEFDTIHEARSEERRLKKCKSRKYLEQYMKAHPPLAR